MSDGLLKNLPPAPIGKTGWPWTEESKPLPHVRSDGKPWPKISIVTPSFNQGQFIEETIRSVLLQNYPNLEYIIIDGGSTDNTVEIIKKYEPWLTYWVSEKDEGQADGIQKGFEKATGEIFAWINSDDYYLPNVFEKISKKFCHSENNDLFIGGIYHINEKGCFIRKWAPFIQDFESLLCSGQFFAQLGCFWRSNAFWSVGGINKILNFAFDYDLFLKLMQKKSPLKINAYIGAFRDHKQSKTNTIWESIGIVEVQQLQEKYGINNIIPIKKKQIERKLKLRYEIHNLLPLGNMFRNPSLYSSILRRLVKALMKNANNILD